MLAGLIEATLFNYPSQIYACIPIVYFFMIVLHYFLPFFQDIKKNCLHMRPITPGGCVKRQSEKNETL